MPQWFELTRAVVMPAQCDTYGHMNVRHYAALFDDAGWHMLRRAGISLSDLRARGLGTVVATLTIDFHRELKAGQLTLIDGAFTRIGGRSFTYELRLHDADSMVHCATETVVEVCFDTAQRVAVPFPDDVRAALATMVVSE